MKKYSKSIKEDLNNAITFGHGVKLEIDGHLDTYFCKVIEVNETSIIVEYHDCTDYIEFIDITDIIRGW